MDRTRMVVLQNSNQVVKIDEGELVGYVVDEHEYIHQKGSPGWSSADTEMFPIIGPVNEARFRVSVPKGEAIQDQHGLLRQFGYTCVANDTVSATFEKRYVAGTAVKNSKFPEKSTEAWMHWPYDFVFVKKFTLHNEGLEIEFRISGDSGMPFMLGYHPAFKLHTSAPIIKTNTYEISLAEVLAVGSRALEVPNCEEITLLDEKSITIKTRGFGHFMCWTEVENMVCIEPITFYPYQLEQQKLHQGFQVLDGEKAFSVSLFPKG